MAPGLFGFGVSVALDRERGWLTLKRALPMPPGAYLASKLAMAMLFAAIIFTILALLATTLGGVRLPVSAWPQLLAVDVFGVLPFCAIGLFVGTHGERTGRAGGDQSHLSADVVPVRACGCRSRCCPASCAKSRRCGRHIHLGQLALGAVGEPMAGARAQPHCGAAAVTVLFLSSSPGGVSRAARERESGGEHAHDLRTTSDQRRAARGDARVRACSPRNARAATPTALRVTSMPCSDGAAYDLVPHE